MRNTSLAASQFNRESEYQQRRRLVADLSLSGQIAHCADWVLALHRTKDEDGRRRTLLLTLKRRNLERTEEDGSSDLVWTGKRYTDPRPAEFYQRLFDDYAGR